MQNIFAVLASHLNTFVRWRFGVTVFTWKEKYSLEISSIPVEIKATLCRISRASTTAEDGWRVLRENVLRTDLAMIESNEKYF